MKQPLLAAMLFLLFSCAKEKPLETLSGTWTIVETSAGTGTGAINVQTYAPSSEITLQFAQNGLLILTGANPGQAMSPLWAYDRYEVLPGNVVRFFQSSGNKEMQAYHTVNGNLFLNYPWARCGYQETFVRIN